MTAGLQAAGDVAGPQCAFLLCFNFQHFIHSIRFISFIIIVMIVNTDGSQLFQNGTESNWL